MPTFLSLAALLRLPRGEEDAGGRPSEDADEGEEAAPPLLALVGLRSNESERATRRSDGPARAPATAPMARADVEEVPAVMAVAVWWGRSYSLLPRWAEAAAEVKRLRSVEVGPRVKVKAYLSQKTRPFGSRSIDERAADSRALSSLNQPMNGRITCSSIKLI